MQLINKILSIWLQIVINHNRLILVLLPITAIILLFYVISNLTVNTDTRDMLSAELDWRKLDIEYESLFPHVVDNLIVIVEAETADEASDAALKLSNELKQQSGLFKSVYYFKDQDFFKQSSLLYLEVDELYDLSDRLAQYQAFLAMLLSDQSFGGFISLLIEANTAQKNNSTNSISPLLDEFNKTLAAYNHSEHYLFSWQSLFSNSDSQENTYREIIITQPVLDYANLFPAEQVLKEIKDIARTVGITDDNNMSLKLTGPVALAHEEFESVSKTNLMAIAGALVLVTIILIVGLGSLALVLIALATLIVGLFYTAAFATFFIGELNLISIAFAVLYIGLGIDFGIHFCLKYRERYFHNNDVISTLKDTYQQIGPALFLCAFTTACGFFTFLITDYQGVAELGLIAGAGMFISLLVTITFIPACLKLFNPVFKTNIFENPGFKKLNSIPLKHANKIILSSLVLAIAAAWLLPSLRFDYDLLNIQPKSNPSVMAFKELLADTESAPLRNVFIASDKSVLEQTKRKLLDQKEVKEVIWLDSFVPTDQETKLEIIDEINLLLGDVLLLNDKKNYSKEEIDSLSQQFLKSFNNDHYKNAKSLIDNIETFNKKLSGGQANQHITNLETALFKSLQSRIDSLHLSLQTEGLTLDLINPDFQSRWANNGQYLLEILPAEDLSDIDNMKSFVAASQNISPNVTGPPVVTIEAGNAVIDAFKTAFTAAFIAIIVILIVMIKKLSDVIFILIPLILAALLTAAVSVLFDLPLNFANIIALPLLFGIGIDSAIHIVHQYNQIQSKQLLLASSSARAILVSAFTTIFSIGNLALSTHTGTASMGKLLVTGIFLALLCTLILTPALLARKDRKNPRHP